MAHLVWGTVTARPVSPQGHHPISGYPLNSQGSAQLGPHHPVNNHAAAQAHREAHQHDSPTSQMDVNSWANSLFADEAEVAGHHWASMSPTKSNSHSLYKSEHQGVMDVAGHAVHQLHQDSRHYGSPASPTDANNWADSLFVDEPDVVTHHQFLTRGSPTHAIGLGHSVEKHGGNSHEHGSPSGNDDWVKWIEGVLTDAPGHDINRPPPTRASLHGDSPHPASSLFKSHTDAEASQHTNLLHDGSTGSASDDEERRGRKYKSHWTNRYPLHIIETVRNTVDAMTTLIYGPADLKTVIKRRYNFMKDLSQDQLDDLARGKSIDLGRKLKRTGKGRRYYNSHWTNGLTTVQVAAVNRFFELEVLPFRRSTSPKNRNQLIRQLSRDDLKAIYDNNQAERERIARMLRPRTSRGAPAVSRGRKKFSKRI